MTSVEAQIEADEIGYWCHLLSPLDNWGIYETVTDSLIEAKREYAAARFVHDHARADRAVAEIADLTLLAGAAAEGLARQRARWMASGDPWPLARL